MKKVKIFFVISFLLLTAAASAQTKINVWLYSEKWKDTNVQNWVKNNCKGVFLNCNEMKIFYADNEDLFKDNSMLTRDQYTAAWLSKFPNMKFLYADEPLNTVGTVFDDTLGINYTIGEIPPGNFEQLEHINCNFTYTSYKTFWFRIFGLNIYQCWRNQIGSWEWLQKTYPSRFKMVWIHLLKNHDDYKELIQWAYDNGKQV